VDGIDQSAGVTTVAVANDEAPWDAFDSDEYFWHNYSDLRDDDAQIIEMVADFFAHAAPRRKLADAIDVGSGTNLYPALTMLPHSARVTLFERAFTNRRWLTDTLEKPQPSWQSFWSAIADGRDAYTKIKNPLDVLAERAEITRGNVFDLKPDQYDIGTMFFVAESITTRQDEFRRATRMFVDSLVSGAPFAAAFMRRSRGYYVGSQFFPACWINTEDVETCLASVARIKDIRKVDSHGLRDGYNGMIVATGWKK
jgi:NNMT/PNMT/TEMT family